MSVSIITGDALAELRKLPADSVHCVVTSPPYWGLRDYGVGGQIGLEPDFRDYIATLIGVFREVRRVLRPDGTLWLNLGDSYAGSWGAEGRRVTESDDPTWHSSQIKNHPKRSASARGYRGGGLKPKDLMLMPARVAIALQEDGWWLRRDIIWHKPNPMPESCRDRCTSAHEYLFHLSKSADYYYDADAIREAAETDDLRRPYGSQGSWALDGRPADQQHGGEQRKVKIPGAWDTGEGGPRHDQPGRPHLGAVQRRSVPRATPTGFAAAPKTFSRNKRSVWTVPTAPFGEAHFATFPPDLIVPCILAGCPKGGKVLDPFFGAGTTGLVADRLDRHCIGIELNPAYAEMARRRIANDAGMFSSVDPIISERPIANQLFDHPDAAEMSDRMTPLREAGR